MNSRQIKLSRYLAENEAYITTKKLAQVFEVSERTLQKDLNLIEDYLISEQFPLKLERKKGTGICLRGLPHEKEKLLTLLSENNEKEIEKKELQELLIFHLLESSHEKICLDDLAEQLFVSRKIVQEELKTLKSYFESYDLKLLSKPGVGIQVIGEEEKKRQLLIRTLRNMKKSGFKTTSLREFFHQDILKVIQETLKEVLAKNAVLLSPELSNKLSNVEIHIYFMLERMKQKSQIRLSPSENEAVNDTPAQQLSSQILARLSTIYPIEFSPDEINYLALRIASILPSSRAELSFENEAEVLAEHLLEQVEELLNCSLKDDDILKNNLTSHLSSTYFRLNYHLSISNPLTKNVFSTYPQLFLILQLILDDYFKQAEYFVPQEEIAYLAIHFQAGIERQQHKKSRRFRVLLVSEYSKAMASFIEARLNRELPELKVIELLEYTEDLSNCQFEGIDFILSTISFCHQDLSVLRISPMITESDVLDIEKYMLQHSPSSQLASFDLSSFTNPFLIFPKITLKQPEEILKFMGENLLSNGYVEAEFVAELLARDKYSSTTVAPLITLPHAKPIFVKKSIISIATLEAPIDWHGEPICLVIVMAVKKELLKNAEFKKLFSVIHYLEGAPHKLQQLCQSDNPLEILNLLSSYE